MATEATHLSSEEGRVLIVDDHRVNRLVLERRLTDNGFEIVCASGGLEALELIQDSNREEAPSLDAVVLDIMMPEIDGMEVLRRIRESHSANDLPVIMATAKDRSEDIVGALSLGANDYVTKPVDIPVLIARLRMQVAFRRTHRALGQAQQRLIDAAKMESLGRLAAGVAHEVKNPLYVLQMGVDYFKIITDPENETAAKTLHKMQNAVDRANSIIVGMVDFSRSEELRLIEADLNVLIEHALVLVNHEINEKGITLDCDLAADLPMVPLDRTKVEQVMINLLTNACHAMDPKGRLEVRTRSFDPQDIDGEVGSSHLAEKLERFKRVILIEVQDDGPGIPEDFTLKLFNPFFTTKPTGEGTGLGLSVSKTIIDLHGGHIEIVNREPHGALARIILGTEPPGRDEARFALDPTAAATEESVGEGI